MQKAITTICSAMRSYSKKRVRNAAGPKFTRARSLHVRPRPGNRTQGLLSFDGRVFACALGRGGLTALKREGDGATPVARMRLVGGYFRPGRPRLAARRSPLGLRELDPRLGWCDAPGERNYNRPVRLPYAGGHERMWRGDRLYDVCVVLDWNLRARSRGRGSAIFLHVAAPSLAPTEGCVAVPPAVMARLLPHLSRRTVLHVLP